MHTFSLLGYYATKSAASLRSRSQARGYLRRHPKTRIAFTGPDCEALAATLRRAPDLEFTEYRVDAANFRAWLREARYPAFAYVVNRTEKFLEHHISLELLMPPARSVLVDVASCRSPFPAIMRRRGHRVIVQDLQFDPGLHGDRLGGNAAEMDLPDESVEGMTLHCSFEHFEHDADTRFVLESSRVLRPGGRVVILPLYLHHEFINMTDPIYAAKVPIDPSATPIAVFGYANRFGRHYSMEALRARVLEPARSAKLVPTIYRIGGLSTVGANLYVNFALVLTKARSV